jgi:hypothetical protein
MSTSDSTSIVLKLCSTSCRGGGGGDVVGLVRVVTSLRPFLALLQLEMGAIQSGLDRPTFVYDLSKRCTQCPIYLGPVRHVGPRTSMT